MQMCHTSYLIDVALKYGFEAPMSHFLLNACRLDSSLLLPLRCRLRSDVREEGLGHQERRRGKGIKDVKPEKLEGSVQGEFSQTCLDHI